MQKSAIWAKNNPALYENNNSPWPNGVRLINVTVNTTVKQNQVT